MFVISCTYNRWSVVIVPDYYCNIKIPGCKNERKSSAQTHCNRFTGAKKKQSEWLIKLFFQSQKNWIGTTNDTFLHRSNLLPDLLPTISSMLLIKTTTLSLPFFTGCVFCGCCFLFFVLPAVHSSFRAKPQDQWATSGKRIYLLQPSQQFISAFRASQLSPPRLVCHRSTTTGPIRSELTHNWFTTSQGWRLESRQLSSRLLLPEKVELWTQLTQEKWFKISVSLSNHCRVWHKESTNVKTAWCSPPRPPITC